MKRSNRLILLIGVFLAIIAFVGILMIFQSRGQTPSGPAAVPTVPAVFATQDVPLGTPLTAEMLEVRQVDPTIRDATAFPDPSLIVGNVARTNIAAGKQLTASDFATGNAPTVELNPPAGQVAMAVQVNQLSGVGALVRTGDYVDIVAGFPMTLVTLDPETGAPVPSELSADAAHSTKVLLQGMQVLGTLLPPPPAPAEGEEGAAPGEPAVDPGQQQIVILSVTPQQAEVIKLAQLTTDQDPRAGVSLVLRSPQDFRDPTTNEPVVPPTVETTGITLQTLVDEYGVLVPEIVTPELPTD